jgi:tetratricopeptide (TPR) repeat protein
MVVEGDLARDQRVWSEAAEWYRQALSLDPSLIEIWVQYGHALKESGDVAAAERAYRTAISQDNQVPDFHLQLGHLLKVSNRQSEAQEAYFAALSLDPNLTDARHELLGAGYSLSEIEGRLPVSASKTLGS